MSKSGFWVGIADLGRLLVQSVTFVILLICYLLLKVIIVGMLSWQFWGKIGPVRRWIISVCVGVVALLDVHPNHSISRVRLIDLSIRNMKLKKARSLITIGGMAVGIGLIVLLMSLGYGLQEVVISRVARLDELRQADVAVLPGSKMVLNDKVVSDLQNLPQVAMALPQIAVVGEVSYRAAVSDIAVYGVTTDYLEQSAVGVTKGKLFESRKVEGIESPSSIRDQGISLEEASRSGQLKIELAGDAKRQAVVNQAMLEVLGLSAGDAVGKTFEVSFVSAVGVGGSEGKLVSVPTDYTIVGAVSSDEAPYFYVPFSDLRSLGIDTYAQVRVVAKNKESLAGVRQQIEGMGFSTTSAVDTVEQITGLFSVLRQVLLVLGLGALFVACLGMFNTLTVSLLERTREVGLMKSMGMRSFEVRELFLTESMIMGLTGGVVGVLLGWVMGKVLSVVISLLSLTQGQGVINMTVVPVPFGLMIVLVAVVVGFMTGFYPARRATKISALNALRYE